MVKKFDHHFGYLLAMHVCNSNKAGILVFLGNFTVNGSKGVKFQGMQFLISYVKSGDYHNIE